jgi:hypothetical protein
VEGSGWDPDFLLLKEALTDKQRKRLEWSVGSALELEIPIGIHV